MAANPRVVTEERRISWDGVTQRLPKGQVLDVPPGSALEREIGRDFLVPLPGADTQEPVSKQEEDTPAEVPKADPPKPKATKKDDDTRDGAP